MVALCCWDMIVMLHLLTGGDDCVLIIYLSWIFTVDYILRGVIVDRCIIFESSDRFIIVISVHCHKMASKSCYKYVVWVT